MSYTPVTLTGHYELPDGTDDTGTVLIVPIDGDLRPISRIIDAGGNTVISGHVKVSIGATSSGSFSVTLPATDDVSLNPTGFGYSLTAHLSRGTIGPIYFALPSSPSTVDVSDLDQVDPATFNPGVTYLRQSANLSDLTSPATARTNLGVYSTAETSALATSRAVALSIALGA